MEKFRLLGVTIVIVFALLPLALASVCDDNSNFGCSAKEFDLKNEQDIKGFAKYGIFFSINYWMFNFIKKVYGGFLWG